MKKVELLQLNILLVATLRMMPVSQEQCCVEDLSMMLGDANLEGDLVIFFFHYHYLVLERSSNAKGKQ